MLSNFDSNPLICDAILFPGKKNSSNVVNSNRVFPRKGTGDRALISTYLDNIIAEAFRHYFLSFSILAIFREKNGWSKLD